MDVIENKRKIDESIDGNRDAILAIAQRLGEHPELGYKENFATEHIAGLLKELGFDPTTGIAVTGVQADSAGASSGPTVVIMGELDAVIAPEHPDADPETGAAHACGHNIQVAAMMGAVIGLVKAGVLEKLDGNLRIVAVPAEEFVELGYRAELKAAGKISFFGGKQELIKRGLFDDVDTAMMIHALDLGAQKQKLLVAPTGNGFIGKNVHYKGVPSHAGSAPEKGVNALNAAMLGMMNIHALRETFPDKERIRVHPMLTKGGDMVNIVPADVRMESYVRAASVEWMQKVNEKISRALLAGAMAVGAEVEIQDIPGYLPLLDTPDLDEIFIANALGAVEEAEIQRGAQFSGSFDIGDVSHILPVLHPLIGGVAGDLHTSQFRITDPDTAVLLPAKIMAKSIVDLLADGAAGLRQVKSGFTPTMTKEQYLTFMDTIDRTIVGPQG